MVTVRSRNAIYEPAYVSQPSRGFKQHALHKNKPPGTMTSFAQQMKGFPYKQVFFMSLLRFSEPLAFTSLFPYIYFMIDDFQVAPNPDAIPKYAGWMTSIFPLVQFFFGVQWGILSDRIGRKPVLLIGIAGTGLSMLMFGFSKNYYMALAARGLMGAVNGNIAVIRTSLGEHIKDRNQQAIAFLTVPILYNVGMMVGPLVGGLANKSWTNSLFVRFPYALPNLIVATFIFFATVLGFLFLEETHPKILEKDVGSKLGDSILRLLVPGIKRRNADASSLLEDAVTAVYDSNNDADNDTDDESITESIGEITPEISNTARRMSMKSKDPYYHEALSKPVIQILIANVILYLQATIQIEFLPILLSADTEPEKLVFPFGMSGGFGWSSQQIAKLFSVLGVVGLIAMMGFPYLNKHIDDLALYRFSLLPFVVYFALQPLVIYTTPAYNHHYAPWLLISLIYALNIVNEIFMGFALPLVSLLTHRVGPKHHKGLVNSLSMSLSALARFAGPFGWGFLMSFAEQHNFGAGCWWVLSAIGGVGFIQAFFLINHEQ